MLAATFVGAAQVVVVAPTVNVIVRAVGAVRIVEVTDPGVAPGIAGVKARDRERK